MMSTVHSEVVNNDGLIALCKHADDQSKNRRVKIEELVGYLEPHGVHVAGIKFIHNDCEWRSEWLVRVHCTTPGCEVIETGDEPIGLIRVLLDTDFDIWDSTVKHWDEDYESTFEA